MFLRIPICWGVLALLLAVSMPAQANISDLFTFVNLPQNENTENGDIGEDQLVLVVSDEYLDYDSFYSSGGEVPPDGLTDPPSLLSEDGDLIMFTFYNIGDYYCSIVDIYFYDGTIVASSVEDPLVIDDSHEGVEFTEGAQPAFLPGTEYEKLVEGFEVVGSADSDPIELIEHGIESVDLDTLEPKDEWLSIVFELQTDMNFFDVCEAIEYGDLRIGLRVHFDPDICNPDGEEQFMTSFTPIPAPGAIMLGGIGVVFVGWLRRQRTL